MIRSNMTMEVMTKSISLLIKLSLITLKLLLITLTTTSTPVPIKSSLTARSTPILIKSLRKTLSKTSNISDNCLKIKGVERNFEQDVKKSVIQNVEKGVDKDFRHV